MVDKRKIKFMLRDTITGEKQRGKFDSTKTLGELKNEILKTYGKED